MICWPSFGGIDKDGIYLDETVLRMSQTHRRMFVQVASQLIKEGKNEKALKALDYAQQVIPSKNVAHDYIMSSSKLMYQVMYSTALFANSSKMDSALAYSPKAM